MILLTGVAGFIGFHVAKRLLEAGHSVLGVDNLNNYYSVELKRDRLRKISDFEKFRFSESDISDVSAVNQLFESCSPNIVINLAAQAGVRYSIENPRAYIDSNIVGFSNLIEIAKNAAVDHFVYASSSSVYGGNENMPFSEADPVSHQLSLYAATKKANESIAHSYSSLFGLPTTGLRFFTVYGPWGRPDMALFKFTKAILRDESFPVFNFGHHKRDFTYIDDIVSGVVNTCFKPAESNASWSGLSPDQSNSSAPWKIYNIGNSEPVLLLDYIKEIEKCLGKKGKYELLPMQAGDVADTSSDITKLKNEIGYEPTTPVSLGVAKFVEWYKDYYAVTK